MFMMKMSHPEHASTIYVIVCLWCTSSTYIYKICLSMFMMKISHPKHASTIYAIVYSLWKYHIPNMHLQYMPYYIHDENITSQTCIYEICHISTAGYLPYIIVMASVTSISWIYKIWHILCLWQQWQYEKITSLT